MSLMKWFCSRPIVLDNEGNEWVEARFRTLYALPGGPATISGGGSLVVTWEKGGEGASAISGNTHIIVSGEKTGLVDVAISGGGALSVTGIKAHLARISGGGTLTTTWEKSIEVDITISGGGSLTVTWEKSIEVDITISGGGSLAVSGIQEAIEDVTISGGGSLTVTGVKHEYAFGFGQELIGQFTYIKNIDEVKNHIIIEGEEYSLYDEFIRILDGTEILFDLDDIEDGANYGKVALTSITAGKIIIAGLDSGVTDQMFTNPASKTNVEAWKHASDVTLIDGGDIYTGSIIAGSIAAGAIETDKLDALAVTAGKIAAGAIETDKLDALAVTAGKIAAGAIETDKLDALAVTADKIAAGAIETDKLDALAVTADKIAANTITADEIAANTITVVELSFGAVNLYSDGGLTIDQGSLDDDILAFKSSDINHQITSGAGLWGAETDTYAYFRKYDPSLGGLHLNTFCESGGEIAFQLYAVYGAASTAKNGAASGAINLAGLKADPGNHTYKQCDNNENIFVIKTKPAGESYQAIFIIDEDGDVLYDGGTAAFQEENDIELLRDVEDILGSKISTWHMKRKDVFKKHKIVHVAEVDEVDDTEGKKKTGKKRLDRFISSKRMNMLFMGAIRQLNEKIESLEVRLNNNN